MFHMLGNYNNQAFVKLNSLNVVRIQNVITTVSISNLRCTSNIMALIDRLTYKVGAPIPITGVQFGMRVEFGYDCLTPADFNNDVSYHARFAK